MYIWPSYKMRNTGDIVSREYLHQQHYNTSFPDYWNEEIASMMNADPIIEVPQPVDSQYKTWVFNGFVQNPTTKFWNTTWAEVDKYTTEELATYETQKQSDALDDVRRTRNELLNNTDYTQFADSPISESVCPQVREYRQLLRDITENTASCCYDSASGQYIVIWPTAPEYEMRPIYNSNRIVQPYGQVCTTASIQSLAGVEMREIYYDTALNNTGVEVVAPAMEDVKIHIAGTYLINVSIVYKTTSVNNEELSIWLRHNDRDVPDSNTVVDATQARQTLAVSFIETFSAGDEFCLGFWGSSTNIVLCGIPPQENPTRPGCPSVIVTVNRLPD